MTTARPNIVFVIADDLAPGDLSLSGNPHARTPAIDALAAGGVGLARYCSGPLCTPARAALFTGRHPYRTRAFDTYLGRSQLDPGEITVARVLRGAGYATGLFGKWHLGDRHPCRPQEHGFDEVLMHCGGGIHQPCDPGRASYFHPDLLHNGVLERHAGYCTDIYIRAAQTWMGAQAALGRPFFAYIATNAPHTPLYVSEAWAEPFRAAGVGDELARLYGMVANIDDNVGRLRRWLDQAGLTDNTIFVFTSDHGPCRSVATERFNCGYRGRKGSMYEGGIHVPAFVAWPAGRWIGGRRVEPVTNPIDWMPTLAAAAGTHPPTDRPIDGADLGPVLAGGAVGALAQRHVVMQWHRGHVPEKFRNCTVIGPRFKWIRPEADDASPARGRAGRHDELYDLPADPGERHNIAAEHPAIVAACRQEYETWFADVSATRPDNYAPPRIALGSVAEPLTLLTWQDWRPAAEGWSAENHGPWLVQVTPGMTYSITVEFGAVAAGDRIELTCGEFRRTLTVADRRFTQYHLDGVALPAGAQSLEATLHPVHGPTRGALRVFVCPAFTGSETVASDVITTPPFPPSPTPTPAPSAPRLG